MRAHAKSLKSNKFSKPGFMIFAVIFACIGGYITYKSLAAPNPNLPGDLNNDNTVNLSDLTTMLANLNTNFAVADINLDGRADVFDLSILQTNYGRSLTPAATEIASEQVCPNQTNNSVSDTLKYTAMVCMTNNARNFNGLGPMSQNAALNSAAASKVDDIINCNDFSHTACGRAFDYWIHFYNYTGNCWGENIAMGYANVHDTFVGWMNSPGHRANILNTNFSEIGVGWKTKPGNGALWVMQLGGCN